MRDGQGGQIGETVYLKPVVRNYAGEESILAPLSSEVTLKYEIADRLYAPVKSGEYIGKIRYMLGEETLAERCVVAGGRQSERSIIRGVWGRYFGFSGSNKKHKQKASKINNLLEILQKSNYNLT